MTDDATLRSDLASASDRYERAVAAVDEIGEDELRRLREAHAELTTTLDEYEEEAIGSGDFQEFIEFQGKVGTFTEELPDDLRHRGTFEDLDDHLQQRRLTESDYAKAREMLAPIAEEVARLDERAAAREAYADARAAVQRRLSTVEDEIGDRERLLELGRADLDAPTERLREPIAAYDEAVTDAFETFKRDASARDVLSLAAKTQRFPLASLPEPPDPLLEYVTDHAAGSESITTLLEYSEYSRSKLDHFVDDPDDLARIVGRRQTYLRRLDADPLCVGWPPPRASMLWWRCRELIQVVDRFAPAEVCELLRTVRALTREDDYERLRTAAVARAELTDEELTRLRDGTVESELESFRAERERLESALSEYPPL
jgi:hypothetical protein